MNAPPGILIHALGEIQGAQELVDTHQLDGGGLCTCNRIWPCNVNVQAAAYVRYWEARFKLMEAEALAESMTRAMVAPTMVLPQAVMAR